MKARDGKNDGRDGKGCEVAKRDEGDGKKWKGTETTERDAK